MEMVETEVEEGIEVVLVSIAEGCRRAMQGFLKRFFEEFARGLGFYEPRCPEEERFSRNTRFWP